MQFPLCKNHVASFPSVLRAKLLPLAGALPWLCLLKGDPLWVFLRLIVAGCVGLCLSVISQKGSPAAVNSTCLISISSPCQFLSWHFTTMCLYLCFYVCCVDSFTATVLYQFSEGRGQIEHFHYPYSVSSLNKCLLTENCITYVDLL